MAADFADRAVDQPAAELKRKGVNAKLNQKKTVQNKIGQKALAKGLANEAGEWADSPEPEQDSVNSAARTSKKRARPAEDDEVLEPDHLPAPSRDAKRARSHEVRNVAVRTTPASGTVASIQSYDGCADDGMHSSTSPLKRKDNPLCSSAAFFNHSILEWTGKKEED